MKGSQITILLLGLALIAVISLLAISNKDTNGWKCTEDGCVYGTDGDYTTQQKCLDVCNVELSNMIKEQMKITDYNKEDKEDEEEDEEDEEEINNWACTSDYNCIRAKEGKFTSKENCEDLCNKPETETAVYNPYNPYYYYYPQTLQRPYPYYYRNSPRYRRRIYPRHHRHHRPAPIRPVRTTPTVRPARTAPPVRPAKKSFRIR